jgi:O-antigen/teichoic acid export membrane protein
MKQLFDRLKTFLQQDPLLTRVLKNSGYLLSATTIGMVLSFAQGVLAARLLGLTAFGVIGLVTTVVTTVNRLFSFRMGEFVIRFFGKEMAEKKLEAAGIAIKTAFMIEGFTSILAFICLWLVAPLGAQLFVKDPATTGVIRLFGLAILANITTESATGVLQVTNQFKKQAVINLVSSIVTLAIITVAFILKGNLLFVLWAYIAGKFVVGLGPILLAWLSLQRELGAGWWRTRYRKPQSFREMLKFGFSTNLSATIKLLVSESELLWVGLFLNSEAAGLYKIAMTIVNPLMMPITPMIDTTFPELARSVVLKKWNDLKRLLRRTTLIAAAWTGSVVLVMGILGKWIIRIAYTEPFVPAYSAMMILLVGFGFSNVFFWNRKLLLAFGKANIPLLILAAAAALKVGLSFWLVPAYGINAEAWLLSGNFILSVGLMVLIGLGMVRKGMQEVPAEAA